MMSEKTISVVYQKYAGPDAKIARDPAETAPRLDSKPHPYDLIEVTDRRNAPLSDQEQRTVARNALREKKLDEAYATWVEDIRGRAYVEMREPPQ